MPKQQSPFIGLISALLPVFVASAIFIQVTNTNPALKQKVNNILGVKSNSESQVNTIKPKSNLARQNYNYTITNSNSETSKANVLASETTSPVVNLIPANNNSTTNNTTSTTTSNNSGYTYYGITQTDKKNMMSYILDNIKQIQDKIDPASLKFNKIKLNGRENSPAIDNIGKNNAYLWINQDKNKLYLKGQGGSRIELLTSKFFARDLRFKGDINILESLNVVGDANIDSDLTIGGTLEATGNTTFDADLLVKKNLQVLGTSAFESIIFANNDLNVKGISSLGAATLANTNINGTLNVEALLSGVTAKFSGNLSAGSANLTGLLTGTTGNFSGNVNLSGTGSTLGNAFFSSPLATNTFTFLGGTISSSDIILTNLLSGNNAKFTGNVSMGSAYLTNNLSAATVQLSGLLSGNSANFTGNVTISATSTLSTKYLVSGSDINIEPGISSSFIVYVKSNPVGGLIPRDKALEISFNETRNYSNFVTDYLDVLGYTTLSTAFVRYNLSVDGNLSLSSTSTLSAGYFSSPLSTNTFNFTGTAINLTGPGAYIQINGKAVTTQSSDRILKSGIEQFSNPMDYIRQLRAVTFNWKNMQAPGETLPGRNLGMIAQEVEQVMPDLNIVNFNPDGTRYIKYDILAALAIEGIKTQQGQIETLSNAIGALNLSSLQDLYNKFNTALENLSMSTEDGKLVVNSGLTVTGEALFNNAKFTGNVQVGQIKVDSLENDISIKASPCVDIDGNINEATCDTNKISIMKNKAGNVEMFDGKVKIKPNGNVLGEKVQAKAFSNSDSSTPSNSDSCTAKDFKFGEKDGKAYIFYCTSDSKWVRSELSSY